MLGIFKTLNVMVDPSNVEDCHWIKSSKGPKKVIVELSMLFYETLNAFSTSALSTLEKWKVDKVVSLFFFMPG